MTTMDIDDILEGLQHDDGSTVGLSGEEKKSADYHKLKASWAAERTSPDILPFEHSLLDRIMARLRESLIFIEENTLNLENERDMKMKLLIVESELERIKFLVRGYLRQRLAKIDKFTLYIQKNEDELFKLSESEKIYMNRHYEILSQLYKNQFLSGLPEALQKLDDEEAGISMVSQPDLDQAVFVRVLENDALPVRAGPDIIDMDKGSIHVFRYRAVEKMVLAGTVELI